MNLYAQGVNVGRVLFRTLLRPVYKWTWNNSSVDQITSGAIKLTCEISTEPGSKLLICTVMQGLGLHPRVKGKFRNILCLLLKAPRLTELAILVNLLRDFDKPGEQSVTGKPKLALRFC